MLRGVREVKRVEEVRRARRVRGGSELSERG